MLLHGNKCIVTAGSGGGGTAGSGGGGALETESIAWDESFQITFVLVCTISIATVPEERKRCSVCVLDKNLCLLSQILQYVIQYTFHKLALFLHMKYDSWWPWWEQLWSTRWCVLGLSLLWLNFCFNHLITKESWWKTLFKVYVTHPCQHVLL